MLLRLWQTTLLFKSFSDLHGFIRFSSLPETRTRPALREWSQLPSPPTISLGQTRGLLRWRKSSIGFPSGLSSLPGLVRMTCTDTEDVAHYRGWYRGELRATGATPAETDRKRHFEENNTKDWSCCLFTPTQIHTDTHSRSLPVCLRDPHHCVSRLSS